MNRRSILLPQPDGSLQPYDPVGEPVEVVTEVRGFESRVVYAAAHVVCDPLRESASSTTPHLDWDATLAYREYLWSMGFGVAEAMDTAQRGMGLDWQNAQELIGRSLAAAPERVNSIVCGAGTDQLDPEDASLDDVVAAYEEQCEYVESAGGRCVIMASRALARAAQNPDDYLTVYDKVLSQRARPVTLHWLGEAFDPALVGYWGSAALDEATDTFVSLVDAHSSVIEGVKVSLLDKSREISLRERLPGGVRVYTGDDYNYVGLIRGDGRGHSHAFLGILDAIAPVAAVALRALDANDGDRFERVLAPTVPLSRHVFSAPTRFYKTGLVLIAYLNGHQSHFRMIRGLESARSLLHLAEIFVLADRAGLLRDPDRASSRMRGVLSTGGIE